MKICIICNEVEVTGVKSLYCLPCRELVRKKRRDDQLADKKQKRETIAKLPPKKIDPKWLRRGTPMNHSIDTSINNGN